MDKPRGFFSQEPVFTLNGGHWGVMEGLGEGGTIRWTTVLGESGEARAETKLSQAVWTMNGGYPKGRGPKESPLWGSPWS